MKRDSSRLFAGCLTSGKKPQEGDLALLGLPDDSRSSFRRGSAQAPQAIRRAYDGDCYNSCSESEINLAQRVIDLGDCAPSPDFSQTQERFEKAASPLFAAGVVPFFLGGDHGTTPPVVRALKGRGPIHVIQLDAHPDLYPIYADDRWSHACVAHRLLEMDHVATVTQLGIRAMNGIQSREAARFGDRLRIVRAHETAGGFPFPDHIPSDARVYLTLDIDVLDPSFAPGVAHPLPGGASPRQLLDWLRDFPWTLIGMDLVEVNPVLDVGQITQVTAARLLHQAMAMAWTQRKD